MNNGIAFGLSISDARQTYIAVTIDKKEFAEYGQPLYWVEGEGYTVSTSYPHCSNMAGVYFGEELFGMRCAETRETFRGIFVLVQGIIPQPVKIQEPKSKIDIVDPVFLN